MNAAERVAALRRVVEEEAGGKSFETACLSVHLPPATIRKWRKRYAEGGIQALENREQPGRPDYARLLSDEQIAVVRQLVLKTDSVALAYDIFKDMDACPGPIRSVLENRQNGDTIPMSLRRAAYVAPELKALHRGPKNYALNSFTTMRDMTELMPDGTRRQIVPGDWWEMDDMSVNHPFCYETACPACGANPKVDGEYRKPGKGCSKLAHRWGREVGRQSLWAIDLASAKWLGFELIGRPRDAYRAEDILRFLRRLFQTYGLPRRGLRLERGVWMSKRIKGYELKPELRADDDYSELAEGYIHQEMPEDEQKVIVGGLAQLGIEVVYCYSPHTKGLIESSFDHLQSIVAAMGDK